ncbi:MAG: alpha/beta hydrolase-fold protein, partial [Verrucomicrobiales bacterium]
MRWIVPALFLLSAPVLMGEVEKLARSATDKGFVSVHYPPGFDPSKRYSVLYWFHGTGGRPNAGIGAGHERFVTVGMSYLKRENVEPGGYGAAHWSECLEVREALEAMGLKLDRNVVAGMSKGGWMSFYIASEVRQDLHAVGIFAAGKDPNVKELPSLAGSDLSVLVGTGETDPNFPQAQLAVQVLESAGATVCYEEWLGEGHTYHRDGRVRDWLDVEARRSDGAELRQFCAQAVASELAGAEAWEEPVLRYIALRRLAGDPRLREAGDTWRKRVRETGRSLASDPAVKAWLVSLNRLRALVRREVALFARRDFEVPALAKLVDAYARLQPEVGEVGLSARVAHGRIRAAKMLAIYSNQLKAREDPQYRALMEEYIQLQTRYGEAEGDPGEAVMERLKDVGARLADLRHKSGMAAFRDAEWSRDGGAIPPEVKAAIEAGNAAQAGRPAAP